MKWSTDTYFIQVLRILSWILVFDFFAEKSSNIYEWRVESNNRIGEWAKEWTNFLILMRNMYQIRVIGCCQWQTNIDKVPRPCIELKLSLYYQSSCKTKDILELDRVMMEAGWASHQNDFFYIIDSSSSSFQSCSTRCWLFLVKVLLYYYWLPNIGPIMLLIYIYIVEQLCGHLLSK